MIHTKTLRYALFQHLTELTVAFYNSMSQTHKSTTAIKTFPLRTTMSVVMLIVTSTVSVQFANRHSLLNETKLITFD